MISLAFFLRYTNRAGNLLEFWLPLGIGTVSGRRIFLRHAIWYWRLGIAFGIRIQACITHNDDVTFIECDRFIM
jgi:hypothetical protein